MKKDLEERERELKGDLLNFNRSLLSSRSLSSRSFFIWNSFLLKLFSSSMVFFDKAAVELVRSISKLCYCVYSTSATGSSEICEKHQKQLLILDVTF